MPKVGLPALYMLISVLFAIMFIALREIYLNAISNMKNKPFFEPRCRHFIAFVPVQKQTIFSQKSPSPGNQLVRPLVVVSAIQ